MSFSELLRSIQDLSSKPASSAKLVGISGIDASGKGYVAGRLADKLTATGRRVALINADRWLNLPHVRFSDNDPGRHFYEHALRMDEMFRRFILPLKRDGRVHIKMGSAEEVASEFRPHTYVFRDVDMILLEGIFIFKQVYIKHFDLKIWIECSFETALSRAVARRQEGLGKAATVRAYESIYFPAQRHHFKIDDPKRAADVVYSNDQPVVDRH